MKGLIFAITFFYSFFAQASGFTVKCGNFTMVAREGQVSLINGEKVTSQKITELGSSGLRVQMGLMPARDGNNYGFEYIHRPGSDSRFLNVQLLQASMDAPRIIGSFPCVKVTD